jgi:pimeloyl-ACP methyl ester carboxylesterase
MKQRSLHRATLQGIELEYEVRGVGDPVVLVPAGICADWFGPLLEESALTDRYRVVNYHRIGYAGSSHLAGPISIQEQAGHCQSLMHHLGIERAHLVGHSSGAVIALQLALDAPDMVQTLALLESARPAKSSETETEFDRAVAQPTVQRYGAGDKAGAIDTWMRAVCGPDYRVKLEQAIPGVFEQAVADADTFFGQELLAVREWSFSQEDARRVTQPVLAVLGEKTGEVAATFGERRELLLDWLPKVEAFDLPDATHLLHVQNPRGMAKALAAFFARHPISTSP